MTDLVIVHYKADGEWTQVIDPSKLSDSVPEQKAVKDAINKAMNDPGKWSMIDDSFDDSPGIVTQFPCQGNIAGIVELIYG